MHIFSYTKHNVYDQKIVYTFGHHPKDSVKGGIVEGGVLLPYTGFDWTLLPPDIIRAFCFLYKKQSFLKKKTPKNLCVK